MKQLRFGNTNKKASLGLGNKTTTSLGLGKKKLS